MYNKSIQLHTSAGQKCNFGISYSGGIYTKENTRGMFLEMFTQTSLCDINAHLQYLYLYSAQSTGNGFGRDDDENRPAYCYCSGVKSEKSYCGKNKKINNRCKTLCLKYCKCWTLVFNVLGST